MLIPDGEPRRSKGGPRLSLAQVLLAVLAVAGCSDGAQTKPREMASARGTSVPGQILGGQGQGEGQGDGQRGEPVAPEPSAKAPATRDLRLVVLMPSGEPAPVVPVRFLDTLLVPRASFIRATGGEPDAEKLLEALGEERMTDGEGRVTFPASGGPLLASAELGDFYAMQPFAPPAEDAEELVLTLRLDASVRAHVIGPAGQPLSGVPIALSMELPSRGGSAGANGLEPLRRIDLAVRESSGEDATVRFRDARGGVQRSGEEGAVFSLRAAIPGFELAASASFDPARPPKESIEISVPALSTFVVEVLNGTGQLVEMEADVFLAVSDAAAEAPRLRARLQSGRATFGAVVPGTLLRVTVRPLDNSAAFEGVGPSALVAGDVATLSVSKPGGR